MDAIAAKLDQILRKYGHDVFLRKVRNGEVIWEKHTTRSRYPAVRGVPQVMEEMDEGIIHNVDMIFYFKAEAAPREGDIIFEEDPRYEGDQPAVQWLIDAAIPNRGFGGEVVYYTAGVTRREPT